MRGWRDRGEKREERERGERAERAKSAKAESWRRIWRGESRESRRVESEMSRHRKEKGVLEEG